MPIMLKLCSYYYLMRVVDQKPDNQLEWPYDKSMKLCTQFIATPYEMYFEI